jgi:chromosome segregation ATPase
VSAQERIKRTLSALASLQKELSSLDECGAGADALRDLLAARQQQIAEAESRLARTKEEASKEDAALNLWRAVHQKEMAKGNAEIDKLHEQLLDLEGQVQTRQQELANAISGMDALRQRLQAG